MFTNQQPTKQHRVEQSASGKMRLTVQKGGHFMNQAKKPEAKKPEAKRDK